MKRREFLQGTAAIGALGIAGCVSAPRETTATPAAGPTTATTDDFVRLDGLAQGRLVRQNEVRPIELVDAAIARIEALNPQINAVVARAFETAREKAASASTAGQFGGVPYLIKDLADYEGLRTTNGSRLFAESPAIEEQQPYYDRVDEAGLIALGKSNTPEFGLLATTESTLLGACHNPWNLAHSTGGSSGGAAAAVASGMVPLADASDGGGSIRIPSSCCGLFGLKPTRGRFDAQDATRSPGDIAIAHPITRSVRDSAAMLSLTQKTDSELPTILAERQPDGEPRRIAFSLRKPDGSMPDADVVAATEAAAALCEELGHEVVEVSTLPGYDPEFIDQFLVVWASGPAQLVAMAEQQTGRPIEETQLLEPWTIGLARSYAEVTATNPDALQQTLARFQSIEAEMTGFFEGYDAWLTPTLASAPPRLGEQAPTVDFDTLRQRTTSYVAYTAQHNVAGTPAMSVPLGWNENGLPIGTQFAAAQGNEQLLLQLAYQLEEARPWADRWAPHSAVNL
ncbi:MAG: amidase [Sphingomonadaceae bacterium]|nr:amidase [Sphingomonadaceae bacterium]